MKIRDSVVIITGASSGVGKATALALARRGARLVLGARSSQELQAVAIEVSERGGEAEPVVADVRVETDAQALAARALAAFGRIDALVNNAGIGGSGAVETLPLETWRACLDTNLTGPFLCSRAVIPAMRRQQSGHIIMIASGAGKRGYGGMAAYSASKFGLIGLAESLADELGDDHIKVCTITPGSILTDFSGARGPRPGAKYLYPEDIAEAIVFLLEQSERAWTQELNLWPFREVAPRG
jgi:3-oxoacyl-[acyl-carrier protein] reductase